MSDTRLQGQAQDWAARKLAACLDEEKGRGIDGGERVHERQVQRAHARPPTCGLPPVFEAAQMQTEEFLQAGL